MGRVTTKLTLWNNTDLDLVSRGMMKPEDVRTEIVDALVDTGATQLVLPLDLCRRLGFGWLKPVAVRLADGKAQEMPHAGSIRPGPARGAGPGCRRTHPAHPDAPIIDLLAAA